MPYNEIAGESIRNDVDTENDGAAVIETINDPTWGCSDSYIENHRAMIHYRDIDREEHNSEKRCIRLYFCIINFI